MSLQSTSSNRCVLPDSSGCHGARVLLLGSDDVICQRLADRHGWILHVVSSPSSIAAAIVSYDVAIVDLDTWKPQEFLPLLNKLVEPAGVIVLSSEPRQILMSRLWRLGIRNGLIKPCSEEQLAFSVQMYLLENARGQDAEGDAAQDNEASAFVGVSPFSRELRHQARLLFASTLPVHLTGESGVGKEVAAQEFHEQSARKDKVFLPVNCSILGNLAKSELFGHSRGAYTSANQSTRGYVGTADGGTLFLDEIGDLEPDVQTKLLRFLDSGEYLRVGESTLRHADVKIITATNKNLRQLCQQGKFRTDLYYRITGAVYQIPPLRERREDIIPLAQHFIKQLGRSNKHVYRFVPDALAALRLQDWPGNARQLRQVIHLLTDKSQGQAIRFEDVARELGLGDQASPAGLDEMNYQQAKHCTLREFDRAFFTNVVIQSQGSLKKALALSGMHKKNFYSKLKELNVSMKNAGGYEMPESMDDEKI